MLAVISPAKRLESDPVPSPVPVTQPVLLSETQELMKITRKLSAAQLQNLMKISDKLADLNHGRFQDFSTPFTPDNAKPAALLFNGDTYLGLDAKTMSPEDLTYAQDHVAILSGLYGLLRPMDLIQPYRLEMGTRLQTPRGANLYAFWGNRITKTVNAMLAGQSEHTIVNLASTEYFSALQPAEIDGRVLTPAFLQIRDGVPKMLGMMAKRARGTMARYICTHRVEHAEGLKDFNEDGYVYREDLSEGDRWVFVREA
jgi:cytoplasmic iron level regulating protein YaaA (DUF328/UPF0246 family)